MSITYTQITVSPCLPYTDLEAFGSLLLQSGAKRIVVDTFVDGDGSSGRRTSHSLFASARPEWAGCVPAELLYGYLCRWKTAGVEVGWSSAGFCGIRPRNAASVASK